MPSSITEFQFPSTFLFQLTNEKRVRFSGYEQFKIDNDGLIAESVRQQDLKISPDKLLHVFEIAAGDGTTNVAFGEDETLLCEGGALRNPSAHG
jgi:hypothetical protein